MDLTDCSTAQVYAEELVPSLLQCMWHLTASSSTVLLAYYRRGAAAHELFWHLLPRHFEFSKIPEESYGAKPHPADVGLFALRHKAADEAAPPELDA